MSDRKPRVSSSSSSSTSAFSSDDETDARDLKSIKGYLSDRRELARQLFKSVKTEKIRMMLPQILKAMNFNDLEEYCASELSGMSEARIVAIVNGQPMLDSSDTSETDDSGPSLEIISDTEEWLTDTDIIIKQEPSSSSAPKSKRVKTLKSKSKNVTGKKTENDKKRAKDKSKANQGLSNLSEVKIKKEKDKDNRGSANKEGESLLDLLELEMRARAIRALIRKEEDIIPTAASEIRKAMTVDALKNTLNSAMSANLANKKDLSNGKSNLTESKATNGTANSPKKSKPGQGKSANDSSIEDEDVVFVSTKTNPTIELLSSDNDEENETSSKKEKKKMDNNDVAATVEMENSRRNKNEKISIVGIGRDNAIATKGRVVTIDKSANGPDSLKIVITKNVTESSNSLSPVKSSKSKKNPSEKSDKNVVSATVTNATEKTAEKIVTETKQSGNGLFKKIKKKQHLRNKRKKNTVDSQTERETIARSSENPISDTIETEKESNPDDANRKRVEDPTTIVDVTVVKIEATEIKERSADSPSKVDETEARKKTRRRITLDEDRLDDFDEIIDLDNYSDDMDDMENNEDSKSANNSVEVAKIKLVKADEKLTPTDVKTTKEKSESSETWATRYYQTDDVQSVMKESKIQSEIRKRLRERQRQSKLNNSPKINSPGETVVAAEKIEEKIETKPTGSVQEYLALKNASAIGADDAEDNVTKEDKSPDGEKSVVDDESSTLSPEKKPNDAPIATNSSQEITEDLVSTETVENR